MTAAFDVVIAGGGVNGLACGALLTRKGMPYHEGVIAAHDAARATGVDVWPQVSCRPLVFQMNLIEPFTLNTSPIFAELMPGTLDERRATYTDPAWRERVQQGWKDGLGLAPRWDTYEIMESSAHPELIGRRLADVAAEAGKDPFDMLLDISADEDDLKLMRVKAIVAKPSAPMATHRILSHQERHQILVEKNQTARDYPRESSLAALFEHQAARAPAATAIVAGEAAVTYGELNERANRIAHGLRRTVPSGTGHG